MKVRGDGSAARSRLGARWGDDRIAPRQCQGDEFRRFEAVLRSKLAAHDARLASEFVAPGHHVRRAPLVTRRRPATIARADWSRERGTA
jgi:hypothetical protein